MWDSNRKRVNGVLLSLSPSSDFDRCCSPATDLGLTAPSQRGHGHSLLQLQCILGRGEKKKKPKHKASVNIPEAHLAKLEPLNRHEREIETQPSRASCEIMQIEII